MGAGVAFRAMRTVEQWFGEYGESHSNPRNELLHIICVPAIVLTVIGFIWSIPVPAAFSETWTSPEQSIPRQLLPPHK